MDFAVCVGWTVDGTREVIRGHGDHHRLLLQSVNVLHHTARHKILPTAVDRTWSRDCHYVSQRLPHEAHSKTVIVAASSSEPPGQLDSTCTVYSKHTWDYTRRPSIVKYRYCNSIPACSLPLTWHCCTPSPWAVGCDWTWGAASGSPQWAVDDICDLRQCRSWSHARECPGSWTPEGKEAHQHQTSVQEYCSYF